MLDLHVLIEKLAEDPDESLQVTLRKYDLETEEVGRRIHAMTGNSKHSSILMTGFIAGLEYASVYNLEKEIYQG